MLWPIVPSYASWWPFADKGLDYQIKVDGVDAETLSWFEHLKLLKKTVQHPPQTQEELAQEGMTLENRLQQALRAKGYYEAQIEESLDTEVDPPALHYTIKPGEQTRISTVHFDFQDSPLAIPETTGLTMHSGDTADAEAINADALRLHTALGQNACFLSLSVTPVLTLDAAMHRAALTYRIAHGPPAHFGATVIHGNRETKEEAIRRNLNWKQGECFTDAALAKSQSTLFGTQLFSTVKITPGTDVDTQGEVPITIDVTERSFRTIRSSVNYATDEGFGVKLGWEHRNFSGGGEKVTVDAVLAQQEQSLSLAEHVPGFLRDDQALTFGTSIKHEDTDAYTSKAFNLNVGIERKINPALTAGIGGAYDLKQTNDLRIGSQTYSLLSAPLFAEYSTRDNAQDAKKGIFARLNVTPYQDMLDPGLHFLKTTATGQTYISSSDMPYKPTLALRASAGSILFSPYSELPADLRYYAGGGGSVRGYSYQSLSPHFNGEPVGGGSLLELNSELRLHITETIGGVVFLDAGNAYASSLPKLNEKLYYGTGVGLRYYSGIGPIRIDVGVPLNGDDIGQHGYALYVSLGQAF